MNMPKDPMILCSVVNTKLRDFYSTLDLLCEDLNIARTELEERLRTVGFEYNEATNRFE